MIRRTLMLCAALLAAVCLGRALPRLPAPPPPTRRCATPSWPSAASSTAGRRAGASRTRPCPSVRAGHLGGLVARRIPGPAPDDSGVGRGHYRYTVSRDRRRYRLVGYLAAALIVLTGGMPHVGHARLRPSQRRGHQPHPAVHRGLRRRATTASIPLPPRCDADGAVGHEPSTATGRATVEPRRMAQRADHGSFSYAVAPDRASYTLRLHRALKDDYVLTGTTVTSPWQQLLASLEDEILRRSGRILAGYVGQWALQHAGTLPGGRAGARPPPSARRIPTGRRTRPAAPRCSRAPDPAPTPTHPAPPASTRSPSIFTPATSRPAACAVAGGAGARLRLLGALTTTGRHPHDQTHARRRPRDRRPRASPRRCGAAPRRRP